MALRKVDEQVSGNRCVKVAKESSTGEFRCRLYVRQAEGSAWKAVEDQDYYTHDQTKAEEMLTAMLSETTDAATPQIDVQPEPAIEAASDVKAAEPMPAMSNAAPQSSPAVVQAQAPKMVARPRRAPRQAPRGYHSQPSTLFGALMSRV